MRTSGFLFVQLGSRMLLHWGPGTAPQFISNCPTFMNMYKFHISNSRFSSSLLFTPPPQQAFLLCRGRKNRNGPQFLSKKMRHVRVIKRNFGCSNSISQQNRHVFSLSFLFLPFPPPKRVPHIRVYLQVQFSLEHGRPLIPPMMLKPRKIASAGDEGATETDREVVAAGKGRDVSVKLPFGRLCAEHTSTY